MIWEEFFFPPEFLKVFYLLIRVLFSSTIQIQAHALSKTGPELSSCVTVPSEASFTSFSLNPLDKWFASEICGLDPAEWVLWPLSRSTQVAVLLLSVWLSIDILDNGTVDVYVIMGRFKERGFFERAVSGFCLKRIV